VKSRKVPNLEQLHQAVDGAASGRANAADDLVLFLRAISRGRDVGLLARAERALAEANPRMWLLLDASARKQAVVTHRHVAGRHGSLERLLAACHPNGFVREAVVAAIAKRDVDVALPMLALRAADWVPEVRDRARQACQRHLDDAPAEAITFLAPVAFAVRARREGGWLVAALDSLLRDGPPEALTTALAAADWRVRRFAYGIGLSTGRLSAEQLLHAATTDHDLPIRVMCAEAAIRAARAAGDGDVPRRLLASRAAAIRAEAVYSLGAAGETGPAIEALVDRSALVRATAQVVVRRAGTDPATRYRALLAGQEPPDPTVIAGLGETGTRSDIDLLRPWLTHPGSRGRAETVRALRRHGDTSPRLLLPLLADPVSSVTRQVTLSVLTQVTALDEDVLRSFLHDARPHHVRTAAYRLLRACDVWTRISVDLELVDDPVPAIRGDARADLANWIAHESATTYSFPDKARAAELSALLAAAEASLGPGQTDLLRFHLSAPDRRYRVRG
jgi:hypothetical protein